MKDPDSVQYSKLPVQRKLVEVDNCPCCSSDSLEIIRSRKFTGSEGICQIGLLEHKDVLNYTLCRTCGFIFFNPRYAPETLSCYYQTVCPANKNNWLPDDKLTNPVYKRREELRFEKIYDSLIRFLKHSNSIADFGGQDGSSLLPFVDKGLESFVIDPSYQPTTSVDSRIKGFKSVDEFLASGNKVDCAISLQTCEHIYEPFQFLKTMISTIRNDGIILVEVPYDLIYMNFLFNKSLEFPSRLHIEHINFFSLKSLKALSSRLRLTPIKIFTTISLYKFGGLIPSLTLIAKKQDQDNEFKNSLYNFSRNENKYTINDIEREVNFYYWLMRIKIKYYSTKLKIFQD